MYSIHDTARAEAAARKMYPRHPDYFPASMLYKIGELMESADKHAEAIPSYKKSYQFFPWSFPAHAALGRCYEEIGELSAALASWKIAADIHAENWAAWEKHRRGHAPMFAGMAENEYIRP